MDQTWTIFKQRSNLDYIHNDQIWTIITMIKLGLYSQGSNLYYVPKLQNLDCIHKDQTWTIFTSIKLGLRIKLRLFSQGSNLDYSHRDQIGLYSQQSNFDHIHKDQTWTIITRIKLGLNSIFARIKLRLYS